MKRVCRIAKRVVKKYKYDILQVCNFRYPVNHFVAFIKITETNLARLICWSSILDFKSESLRSFILPPHMFLI
jgi:hypothetical protein